MFDKLKNIKFSFKKKSKEEDLTESSLDDDIFSASGSEGGDEDFFSEPSFGAEGGDEASADQGNISFADSSEDIVSTPDSSGESSKVIPDDDILKSSKVVKGGSTKRTLLLFILFVVFAAYAAYAYILPQYYPDLLAELLGETQSEQVAPKKEAPKRVAIKKTIPPKPVPSKPAPEKPAAESDKTKVPLKPAEKAPAPSAKSPGEAKQVEAKPLDDGLEPVEEEIKTPKKVEVPKPAPAKLESKPAPAKVVEKAAPPATPPARPKEKVAAPVKSAPRPPVVPSKKAAKDIKITKGTVPVSAKGYYLQVGVYIFKGNLKSPAKKIELLGYSPLVKQGRKVIKMNRLLVGEWGDFLIAEDLVNKLRKSGFTAELISKNERFSALIGSFYYKHMADKKKTLLRKKGFDARIEKTPINMKVHHLLVGPYNTPQEADTVLSSLKSKGLKAVIIHKR